MGKIQLLAVHVEGNDQTISEALKIVSAAIESNFAQPASKVEIAPGVVTPFFHPQPEPEARIDGPAATNGSAKTGARPVSNRTVRAARREKPARRKARSVDSNGIPCDVEGCSQVCAGARGLGIHKRAAHGIGAEGYKRKLVPKGQELPCGVSGCFEKFRSATYRLNHWRLDHGQKV